MEYLERYEEWRARRQNTSNQTLLEFRNAPKVHVRRTMNYGTIRKILKKTDYVPGESLYLYNVISILMIKRK